jgi:uncharacterized protein
MIVRVVTAIFCVAMATAAVAGPLDDGMAAAQRGDYATALTLLRPIAEQGDANAEYTVGDMYDRGNGVPQDCGEAVKWYTPAAKRGVAAAQDRLGFFYSFGKGVPRDYAEAAKWYRRAAEQGVATAQVHLGALYANGWGVPKDEVSAEFWFILAAGESQAAGESASAVHARDFEAKSMTPDQLAEAQRLAREWKPKKQASVTAGPLEDGRDAAERGDYATALTIWRPLADKGDAHAQFEVGLLYETGHGVALDYAEAAKWYGLSADQGLATAQDKLGFMYTSAKGVRQDYAEAAKWYRLSADQGLASAQHGLGILYSNGTGVPQDDISAYVWFKLAAAQGDKGAGVNLNMLAKLMPADKVAEAEHQAKEWKPKTQP